MNDPKNTPHTITLTAITRPRGGVSTGVRAGRAKTTEKVTKQLSDFIHS